MSSEAPVIDDGSITMTTLPDDVNVMATEEFRNETKYVVLNILGLVPPTFELEGSGEEDSEGGGSESQSENEDDARRKSTGSTDSQLHVVGHLELEESENTAIERQDSESDKEVEGEIVEKSDHQESREHSQPCSPVHSHGTPKFVIEEYLDPSNHGSPGGHGYGSPGGHGYGGPAGSAYGSPGGHGYGGPAGSTYGGPADPSKKTKLTRLVMPLREELSHHLDTLDEKRGCASPRLWSSSPRELQPPSPEAMIASRIAAIGDQIMQEHQQRQEMNSAVSKLLGLPQSKITYDIFKEAAKDVIEKEAAPSGWYQIASMLNFSRHVALRWMKKGERRIGQLTDYSVKLIEENMANFIVEQGGWEALYQVQVDDSDLPSSEIHSNPSDLSFPSSPWPDGFLSVPLRKSSGSEVSDPSSGPPSPSWRDLGQNFLIPGKPYRVTPSNLLRTTPSNIIEFVPTHVSMGNPSTVGTSELGPVVALNKGDGEFENQPHHVIHASGNFQADDETAVGFDESSACALERKKSVQSDACTQTFEDDYDSPDADYDDADVVASMFGLQLDNNSVTDAARDEEGDASAKHESGTQTDAAQWLSVSSTAAALALGVGVGIAAIKKS